MKRIEKQTFESMVRFLTWIDPFPLFALNDTTLPAERAQTQSERVRERSRNRLRHSMEHRRQTHRMPCDVNWDVATLNAKRFKSNMFTENGCVRLLFLSLCSRLCHHAATTVFFAFTLLYSFVSRLSSVAHQLRDAQNGTADEKWRSTRARRETRSRRKKLTKKNPRTKTKWKINANEC